MATIKITCFYCCIDMVTLYFVINFDIVICFHHSMKNSTICSTSQIYVLFPNFPVDVVIKVNFSIDIVMKVEKYYRDLELV